MADLSIFKLDSEIITIKDGVARQTADSAKTLATTASGNADTARQTADSAKTLATTANGNATTALNKVNDLANKLYPVGSIYMSVNATNPAELFGGTWERLKDQFLLAAGDTYDAGSTGGEAQHTLTVDEMPSHTHTTRLGWSNTKGWGIAASESGATNATVDADTTTEAAGGGKPHNNMPPYLAVYMWKRMA